MLPLCGSSVLLHLEFPLLAVFRQFQGTYPGNKYSFFFVVAFYLVVNLHCDVPSLPVQNKKGSYKIATVLKVCQQLLQND